MAEQSQNKTEHVMNVENNGPTLLTMIQLHQNFNFLYLIFQPGQVGWREMLWTEVWVREEEGNQLGRGVTLICISAPIRPSTRACPGPPVVSTELKPHWFPARARALIGPLGRILTVRRDESTNQP